jgi:hypothetical protein
MHLDNIIEALTLARQYELIGVARTTVYAPQLVTEPNEQEMALHVTGYPLKLDEFMFWLWPH